MSDSLFYISLILLIRIIDNSQSERKVWFDKTYTAVEENDLSPVRNFYRTLDMIKEDIYHAITPHEEMLLSEEEQSEFEKSKNVMFVTKTLV